MAEDVQFRVRLPAELHHRLTVAADANFRTVPAEMAYALNAYYGAPITAEERAIIEKAHAILARVGEVNTAHNKNSEE